MQRLLLVVILTFSIHVKSAEEKPSKDLNVKVQDLIIEGDRKNAIKLISDQIEIENENAQLSDLLSRVSHMFFTEEANKLYQLGFADYFKNIDQAIDSLEKAAKLEADNFSILTQLTLLYMRKRQCSKAGETIKNMKLANPKEKNIKVLELQYFSCTKEYQNLDKYISQSNLSDELRAEFAIHYSLVRVKSAFFNNNLELAEQLLDNHQAVDQNFPEFYYWKWKL